VTLALLLAAAALASAQSVALLVPPAGPAREAWQALEDARYKDAEAAFDRALAAKPDDATLLLGSGIVARRLNQASKAKDALTRALQIDPALTPASLLLGTMLHEAGDLESAIRVYEAGLVRAPGHPQMQARVEEWRKEATLHEGFRQAQGSHFTVLFEGPAEEDIAAAAVEILERAYDRIGDLLQTYPANTVTVVLYTQQQFRDVTRTPGWSGGLFDGRIRLPIRGGLGDPRELERVLTHEYVHALIHSVAAGGVPTWLNEGMAMALEPGGVAQAERELTRGRPLMPLDQLRGSFASLPADRVALGYAESALAAQDIIERAGTLRLMGLLSDLASGADFDRSFVSWVQISFAEFERELMVKLRGDRRPVQYLVIVTPASASRSSTRASLL
jgi:tetratricopeptide (TPR) repeat protein